MTGQVAENPFDDWVERYGDPAGEVGPVLFVEEQLLRADEKLDRWQIDVLKAFGRRERKISIASCHGPGKTFTAACCIVYMLVMRFPQLTAATAPSKQQLEDALLKEVHILMARLGPAIQDLFEITAKRISLKAAPKESFFTAATARAEAPEALQGKHSKNVLLVVDEASGVHENVFEAGLGSMSDDNATTLMLSNPTRTTGTFFDSHHTQADDWWTRTVGHEDSPRVSDEFAKDVAKRYGKKSNVYRIRVLGLFPRSDDDTLISRELVESARERDIVLRPHAPEYWGVDVARFGDDRTCLIRRTNRTVYPDIEVWGGRDTMETVGKVKSRWDRTPDLYKPVEIFVDVIGIGSGVVDRLRELGLPVREVNVAESASLSDRYVNARSELWWKCREWLERKDVTLPPRDPDVDPREDPVEALCAELTMPKYRDTSSGKLEVEPKDRTKKRLKRSPDVADALIITFAGDLSTVQFGSRSQWTTDQPIKRDLSLV